MTTPSRVDLSTVDPLKLDAESLRLLTRAVEAEARRMRAEAIRDLIRGIARFIRQSMSIREPRRVYVLQPHH